MRHFKTWMLLALLVALTLLLSGCACKHPEVTTVNAVEATCTEDGYTGDAQCTKCNEIVTKGEAIPATGHTPGEPEGVVEATCTEDGYTGDVKCAVCGETVEAGEAVAAAHSFGEDHACASCGWLEPGLYVADELVIPWADLLADGSVNVKNGCLTNIHGDFQQGKLVIGEDVTEVPGIPYPGIRNNTLTEVWIPRTVTSLGAPLLYSNRSITTIRLFCDAEVIPANAFGGFNVIEEVLLADGTPYTAE